jgi:hypothetical protein
MFRFAIACSLIAGCTTDNSGPGAMLDHGALAKFNLDDRAFVEGHALGVLYLSQRVPMHTQNTGFTYQIGLSAPHAQVAYQWKEVVSSSSTSTTTSAAGVCNEGIGSDCGSGSGSGSGSGGSDGSGSDGGGGDGSCETFLNPAVDEAKQIIANLDLEVVMGSDYAGQTAHYSARFQAGVAQALASEDEADQDPGVEFGPVRDQAIHDDMCTHSPLVLDVDGTGIETTTVAAGVAFDLLANGRAVQTAWPARGALLVLDRDGDGQITSGRELFGNGDGAADGFAALAAFDLNGDGVIDARDPVYAQLALWRDANHDGASAPGELTPLAASGIRSIPLAHAISDGRDSHGNPLHELGRFVRADGSAGDMIDVWFRYHAGR